MPTIAPGCPDTQYFRTCSETRRPAACPGPWLQARAVLAWKAGSNLSPAEPGAGGPQHRPRCPAAAAPKARAAPGSGGVTHAGAAHGHDEEGLHHAGHAHDPRQAQEEDHAQNVLQAGQVDADEGAHARALRERRVQGGRLHPRPGTPQPSGPGDAQGRRTRKGASFSGLDQEKRLKGHPPPRAEQDAGRPGTGPSGRGRNLLTAREQTEQPGWASSSTRGAAGRWESLGEGEQGSVQHDCSSGC